MLVWIDFKEVTTKIQKGKANKTEWSTTTAAATTEEKLFEKKVEQAFTISDGIFEFQDVLQLDSTLKLVFLHLFGRFCSLLSRVWFFFYSLAQWLSSFRVLHSVCATCDICIVALFDCVWAVYVYECMNVWRNVKVIRRQSICWLWALSSGRIYSYPILKQR